MATRCTLLTFHPWNPPSVNQDKDLICRLLRQVTGIETVFVDLLLTESTMGALSEKPKIIENQKTKNNRKLKKQKNE